ncbi:MULTISPECIES: sigma-54 dependent transcriptional regulator [Flavobacteriaceae]|uniref:sigma-54-dependent transcriptional regulator n=1 Tax=Flavobacteriaceae TaxID=49546 RepID=UPI0010AE9C16|nr:MULTISPECIES: sigma-54 dependent transcriptional regulator [Flavobacteriaceae]NJB36841.1 sigma-54-dependent Fis family transcriptional regulator [Croceivirga sp. JEA036]TKD65345.1 sigma-54-dependent Fis family transcriptional regulator [Flavobacterium sp. ASW18X]
MAKQEATVLILDDDKDILFSMEVFLKRHFSKVLTTTNPKELVTMLNKTVLHLVVMDMNFRAGDQSGKEGLYWLKLIKERSQETMVVLMTAYANVDLAVESLKKGAFDFVLKPWDNDKLLATLQKGLSMVRSNTQQSKLQSLTKNGLVPQEHVLGKSQAFKEVLHLVEKVADTQANVLLLGENGTGKYVIAKMLHQNSARKDNIFVHVDLGSLNENLFESELFGHAKGAFTDAKEDSLGRFELADEGTLFLDEIGNLPMHLQSKLLTVLQTKKVVRLGESKERTVNVRIICATNMDLHQMVVEQRFRQDLLYRINTMEIVLPALRERSGDVALLAHHFLEKNKRKYQKGRLQFSIEALNAMEKYHWPGNIRELEHIVERAVILSEENEIQESDLRFGPAVTPKETVKNLNLEATEKHLIQLALKKHTGNVSKAAKELGITRAALYRRMEKHNL